MKTAKTAILILLVVPGLLAFGCAGREQARRTALLLADATDTYVKEVSGKIEKEQTFYDRAREDFETQLRMEEEKNKSWEARQPSFELLDFVEQLVRDENRLQVPGDFYGVLLDVNRLQEERARKIAESRAGFRKTFELNLARFEFKRSELERLRAMFEALAVEMSLRQKLEFIFKFVKETKDALEQRERPKDSK